MSKTLIFFLSVFILISGNTFSQSKFGNATMEELTMTEFPQDSAASAVILSKTGETRFTYNEQTGFQFEYTLKMKVKILKNEGLDICNQSISYYQENRTTGEKITGLSSTTYNLENGKIVKTKLSKDYIFDENVEDMWKIKKFTIPAAKVGSVVEFKYTLSSIYLYQLRDFKFQDNYPILYTSYEIIIPEYYNYNFNMQGYEKIKTESTPTNESFLVNYRDDNGRMRSDKVTCRATEYTFTGTDIPRIKDEPLMWTLNDYITKISFELRSTQYPWSTIKSLTTTWKDVDKRLFDAGEFGGNLKRAGLFKEEIDKGDITLDRAREIQNLVKSKAKWNDSNSLTPKNLKDALKTGLGNSADMNFLLINALKAGGFDAYPVVMSTRSSGRLPIANPSVSELNYTITGVKIDTAMYYTDASSRYGDWNILPHKALVEKARVVDPAFSEWIDLSTLSKGVSYTMANIKLTDKGMVANVTEMLRGESALLFKENYFKHKDQVEYLEKKAAGLSGDITDYTIKGVEEAGSDVKTQFTFTKEMDITEDILYLNPLVEKIMTENPLKAESRKFPINFSNTLEYKQIISIEIPEGYVVDELPQSEKFVFGENDLVWIYKIAQTGNKIQLQIVYQVNKLTILQTEYTELQDFFSKMTLKNSEQIVLKKGSAPQQ